MIFYIIFIIFEYFLYFRYLLDINIKYNTNIDINLSLIEYE